MPINLRGELGSFAGRGGTPGHSEVDRRVTSAGGLIEAEAVRAVNRQIGLGRLGFVGLGLVGGALTVSFCREMA